MDSEEPLDVIFLDVSMPPENGFDVLPHVPVGIRVVFVTAHADYAVRAFEENAAAYCCIERRALRERMRWPHLQSKYRGS